MDKEETENYLHELKVLRDHLNISTGKEAEDNIEEMMADITLLHIDKAIEALEGFCNG